jgi:glycerol-3-phosphate dehydrogenase
VSSFDRRRSLERLVAEEFDLIVIGAGMTGAGVAVDAAQRGLSVALIDAGDIASGTSSKSSKMVHGGLRYLQQRELRLVYENLRERRRLMANAPHLVRILPFLIPLFGRDGVVSATVAKSYSTALRLYDLTGGWRIGRRYRKVSRDEALGHVPSLKVDRLVAGFLYFDARGDDARVALTLAQTAAHRFGAAVANYVRAIDVEHASGRVAAVRCRDEVGGAELTVRCRSLVNATGVWADRVFSITEHEPSRRITPAKGVHVTVRRDRLAADVAAVLAVPGDRRSIFVVPFEDGPFTYIGTTDTEFTGDLDDPLCEGADVEYLLRTVNAWTNADIKLADVTGVWAGLRPLLAPEPGERLTERTADLSRRHKIIDAGDGAVHVTGGKWTTYRQMAEDAVDAVMKHLRHRARCRTADLPLFGAPVDTMWRPSDDDERRLYERYGVEARAVSALIRERPELAATVIEGLPYVGAEFVHGARHEMVVTLVDLLARRTRAHLMDARSTLRAAAVIAPLVADDLGWDDARVAAEVAAYRDLVERELSAAGLPFDEVAGL